MIDRDAADTVPITCEDGSVFYAPAVQILNMRGEYSATLGCLPEWIRPYMKVSPRFTFLVIDFEADGSKLPLSTSTPGSLVASTPSTTSPVLPVPASMSASRTEQVSQPLSSSFRPSVTDISFELAGDRKDILSHLQNGRDAEGKPMGVPELTAEGMSEIVSHEGPRH